MFKISASDGSSPFDQEARILKQLSLVLCFTPIDGRKERREAGKEGGRRD